jgi:hypothetical protein
MIPADAARLLERGTIDLIDALDFLGVSRTLGYSMAARYLRRIAKLTAQPVFDIAELAPRRDPKTGAWREVPAYQVNHKFLARSDRIVPMSCPEVPWPWTREVAS